MFNLYIAWLVVHIKYIIMCAIKPPHLSVSLTHPHSSRVKVQLKHVAKSSNILQVNGGALNIVYFIPFFLHQCVVKYFCFSARILMNRINASLSPFLTLSPCLLFRSFQKRMPFAIIKKLVHILQSWRYIACIPRRIHAYLGYCIVHTLHFMYS